MSAGGPEVFLQLSKTARVERDTHNFILSKQVEKVNPKTQESRMDWDHQGYYGSLDGALYGALLKDLVADPIKDDVRELIEKLDQLRVEYRASHGPLRHKMRNPVVPVKVVVDPTIPPRTAELRDDKGKTVAKVVNVGEPKKVKKKRKPKRVRADSI